MYKLNYEEIEKMSVQEFIDYYDYLLDKDLFYNLTKEERFYLRNKQHENFMSNLKSIKKCLTIKNTF